MARIRREEEIEIIEIAEGESAPCEAEAEAQNQCEPSLVDQINRLGAFILALDCGYPRANEEFPGGMGVTEAAEAYIKELRGEIERWREAHSEACKLVVQMHAAAVGEVTGPKRGVVEDVEDVVNGLKALAARAKRSQNIFGN